MTNNGNGIYHSNGSHPWWQIWNRERDLDLAGYRRLALQLHHGLPRADNALRSVLVVTPNESRFWAKGCVTLASCMAEELHRPVLLMDVDDDCEVSRMLGGPAPEGLLSLLAEPTRPLKELALLTNQQNVWFLSTGTSQSSPFRTSPESAYDLLVQSGKQWDFVVVAGGPVLRNPFALAMAPYVGRVLLLVIENHTHIEDIDAAQNALEQCRAQSVSLVLTQLGETVR